MTEPAFTSTTSPVVDHIRAGEFPALTEDVTIAITQVLVAGAVLGRITVGVATALAAAGNTGNGVISAITTGAGAKVGVYKAIAFAVAANLGRFTIEDPDGITIGTVNVGVAFAGAIGFTISDGSADFIAGDTFNITVAAGSGQYLLSVAAAIDGSQIATRILAKAINTTAAAAKAPIYATGEFDSARLTFGAGHTAATVRTTLRAENIYLRDVLAD